MKVAGFVGRVLWALVMVLKNLALAGGLVVLWLFARAAQESRNADGVGRKR